jgi:hypothetical protein
VFKDNVEKYYVGPDMLDQAALILKKCHGLPLAISTIGGFLATKPKTATEWRKVNDHYKFQMHVSLILARAAARVEGLIKQILCAAKPLALLLCKYNQAQSILT